MNTVIVVVDQSRFRYFETFFMDYAITAKAFKEFLAKVNVFKAVTTIFFNK